MRKNDQLKEPYSGCIPMTKGSAKYFRWAVVVLVTIFPLVLFPSIERPFSMPKIYLLEGFVVVAGIYAMIACRLNWSYLPKGFRLTLIAWPSALAVSALFGQFVSHETFWLSLFCIGWFLIVINSYFYANKT